MPTPVKYYNPQIREAYGEVERTAGERMLSMLPEDIRESYRSLLIQEEGSLEARLVKAADKLSALIKCIEERKAGNMEFVCAQRATEQSLRAMELPEADAFLEEFIPAYSLTLDEQGNM